MQSGSHRKREAETGGMWPPARDTWGLNVHEAGGTLSWSRQGVRSWVTLTSDLWPLLWERRDFCCCRGVVIRDGSPGTHTPS